MDRCNGFGLRRALRWILTLGFGVAGATSIALVQAQELCGGVDYPFPYTDVVSVGAAFCPGIMEAYVTGVSKGTTPTTFSPNENVSRVQMTTFLQRSLDQGLARTSRRAALDQWWTPQSTAPQTINVGGIPLSCAADGESIWVATFGQVVRVQASTGAVLGTWTGADSSYGVRVALGKVWIVAENSPGSLYLLDPTQAPGPIPHAYFAFNGNNPVGLAFDGTSLWSASAGPPGSVSIFTLLPGGPGFSAKTFVTGFSAPFGILYDGAHIWVTDNGTNTLLKLDSDGNITQTVNVGLDPATPVFDGANIWVPNHGDNSITVVQASTGNVVATIVADASNLLDAPTTASFDGERVLVTNFNGNSVTLFKAADLSLIANVTTGSSTLPWAACSDGINFWVGLSATGNLLRF